MEYYVGKEKVLVNNKVLFEGEEATLYKCGDNLAKILKTDRRTDIIKPNEEFYDYLKGIPTKRFYLPLALLYDKEGNFVGTMIKAFWNREKISHAQLENIQTVISELKYVEEDIQLLTEKGVAIKDMKLDHLLYSAISHRFAVVDFGLFEKSSSKQLLLENLKEINYYLRQGLLWANYEGTKNEMLGVDFPETYDDLDCKESYFSKILEEEARKYGVSTLQELKHVYQKMKFY